MFTCNANREREEYSAMKRKKREKSYAMKTEKCNGNRKRPEFGMKTEKKKNVSVCN